MSATSDVNPEGGAYRLESVDKILVHSLDLLDGCGINDLKPVGVALAHQGESRTLDGGERRADEPHLGVRDDGDGRSS